MLGDLLINQKVYKSEVGISKTNIGHKLLERGWNNRNKKNYFKPQYIKVIMHWKIVL